MQSMAIVGLFLTLPLSAACGRIGYDGTQTELAEPCLVSANSSRISLDLSVEFETPNTIRWNWDHSDPEGVFASYEIALVEAEKTPMAPCSVRIYDATENPELGYAYLPMVDSVVEASITAGLDPDTDYLARLIAVQLDGTRSVSNTVAARTRPAPTGEITLFSDTPTDGYSIPAEVEFASDNPFAGSGHYRFLSSCETPSCFENLRRQGIGVPTRSMPESAFDNAYYEFALASTGEHSFYSQVRLSFRLDGSSQLFVYPAFVHRADGDYHVYQFPLRVFYNGTTALTHAAIRGEVHEFTVGGIWELDATVLLDEFYLRW